MNGTNNKCPDAESGQGQRGVCIYPPMSCPVPCDGGRLRIILDQQSSEALTATGGSAFMVIGRASHPDDPARWVIHLLPARWQPLPQLAKWPQAPGNPAGASSPPPSTRTRHRGIQRPGIGHPARWQLVIAFGDTETALRECQDDHHTPAAEPKSRQLQSARWGHASR
jgi:hypothetical protein